MLRLTWEIERSGLSRFKIGLRAGMSPQRVEELEAGRTPYYTESDRLGRFFRMNGYQLFEEVTDDAARENCF
jgi:hypothetical protein